MWLLLLLLRIVVLLVTGGYLHGLIVLEDSLELDVVLTRASGNHCPFHLFTLFLNDLR